MRSEICALIHGYGDMNLGDHLKLCPFSKMIVVKSPLGPLNTPGSSITRFLARCTVPTLHFFLWSKSERDWWLSCHSRLLCSRGHIGYSQSLLQLTGFNMSPVEDSSCPNTPQDRKIESGGLCGHVKTAKQPRVDSRTCFYTDQRQKAERREVQSANLHPALFLGGSMSRLMSLR